MANRRIQRRHEIQILDKTTGQALDFMFIPPKGLGGKWVRVFQDGQKALLAASPELRGESLRVLLYLESVVMWRNVLPRPKEAAQELGLHEKAAYRAYAELIKAGFVWKYEGKYYLSPVVGWKGTEAQLEEGYHTTFASMGYTHLRPVAALLEDASRRGR